MVRVTHSFVKRNPEVHVDVMHQRVGVLVLWENKYTTTILQAYH